MGTTFRERTVAPARNVLGEIDNALWRAEAPLECGCGCGILLDGRHTSLDFASLVCQELWYQHPGHEEEARRKRAAHREELAWKHDRYRRESADHRRRLGYRDAEPEPWVWPGTDLAVGHGYTNERLRQTLAEECPEGTLPDLESTPRVSVPQEWEGTNQEWLDLTPTQRRVWLSSQRGAGRRGYATRPAAPEPEPAASAASWGESAWRAMSQEYLSRIYRLWEDGQRQAAELRRRAGELVPTPPPASGPEQRVQTRLARVTLTAAPEPEFNDPTTEREVILDLRWDRTQEGASLTYDTDTGEWTIS